MPEFKVGDVVQLKGGGPKMTVEHPPDAAGENIGCTWLDEEEYPHHARFTSEILQKITDDEKEKETG